MRRTRAGLPGARVLVSVLLPLLAVPGAAAAQEVVMALSGGASIGRYTETDAGLETLPGPAYGVSLEIRPFPAAAGYVAFGSLSFGCEEGLCAGQDVSLTTQGVTVGVRVTPPVSWSQGLPWLRAGVAYMALDVEGEAEAESLDAGVGFEVAAGADFPLENGFVIRSGIGYLRHDASSVVSGHAAALSLTVGVAVPIYRF